MPHRMGLPKSSDQPPSKSRKDLTVPTGYIKSMSARGGNVVYLSLVAIVGPLCSTREDGIKVNQIVSRHLNEGSSVKLDFHGVKLVTPSFYSAAVADLYCTFPDDVVSTRVTITEMPPMELFR